MNEKDFIWVEKYAPSKISDCILSTPVRKVMEGIVESRNLQNMILYSSPGTGKTTCAVAICEEIGADYIIVNGSNEGRLLDTVRNLVVDHASSTSLGGNEVIKVVIYDEFDNVGKDVQLMLRGVINEVQSNCRFIFTCNYISKVLPAILSRCSAIDFALPNEEKQTIAMQFMKRCITILETEGVEYDKAILADFIMKFFPDFRKIIQELQRYSNVGKIDIGIIDAVTTNFDELYSHLEKRSFKDCREWLGKNSIDDMFYSRLMDHFYTHMPVDTHPNAVMVMAEYQYKHSMVADPELNASACIIQLIVDCFK